MESKAQAEFDVFLSHASEDKDDFVRPLVSLLRQLGVSVWYDETEIGLGESLSRAIDRGLAIARFGAVVLSTAFFAKRWPERELSGLVAREMIEAETRILPIWYGVTKEDVLRYSPPLADKRAVLATKDTVEHAAGSILAVVRPDIFAQLQRRVAALLNDRSRSVVSIPFEKILADGPIRHHRLPESLVLRIRLLRSVMKDVFPRSDRDTIDDFRRDMNPEKEVAVWERIAAAYASLVQDETDLDKRRKIFGKLLALSMGSVDADDEATSRLLEPEEAERVARAYAAVGRQDAES